MSKCPICEKRREYLEELNERSKGGEFLREKMRTNNVIKSADGEMVLKEMGYVESLNECPTCGVTEDELDLFKDIGKLNRRKEELDILIYKCKKDIKKAEMDIFKCKEMISMDANNDKFVELQNKIKKDEEEILEKNKDLKEIEEAYKKLDPKRAHVIVSTKMDSFDGKSHHHECFTCGKRWPEKGCYEERYVDDALEG